MKLNLARKYDGSYHATTNVGGTVRVYCLRKNIRSNLWALYINDKFQSNQDGIAGCTFKGAKARAEADFADSMAKA